MHSSKIFRWPLILYLRATVIVLLFIFAGMLMARQPSGPKITGTYTSLQYIEESGDLVGEELRIVYTDVGYEGTLQVAEGVPSGLIVVNIRADRDRISFEIPEPSEYAGSFSGEIVGDGIIGQFPFKSGGTENVTLKRGKSYWD